jgi:hypothetical protein
MLPGGRKGAPWLKDLQLPAYRQMGSGRLAQDAEVAAPGSFGSWRRFERGVGAALARLLSGGCGPGRRLADSVCQGQKIVRAGLWRLGRHGEPQDFPAAGNGERVSVLPAEVVAVRLGVGGERSQDCC